MSSPDPKPAGRVRNPQAFRDAHAAEKVCRLCGGTPISVHHLIPRSRGGDDVYPGNLVGLCGNGTMGCHSDVEHYRNNARYRLRAKLTLSELEYIITKRSKAYLDRQYPIDDGQISASATKQDSLQE